MCGSRQLTPTRIGREQDEIRWVRILDSGLQFVLALTDCFGSRRVASATYPLGRRRPRASDERPPGRIGTATSRAQLCPQHRWPMVSASAVISS